MATATKKTSLYQKLVKIKFKQCAGKATGSQVKSAASSYVTDAVKKGKTKAQAMAVVNRLMKRGCKVAGPAKRKAAPKRKARSTKR